MIAIRRACQALVLVFLASSVVALAREPAKPALKLTFDGVEYVHRTTVNGRSDFTPASQPGADWRDRMTIIVRENVTSSDQLSGIAANLVETVGDLGEVVSTESVSNPRTQE